jgi:predicted nucleic acid-binding Zn ribbon protein
MSKIITCPICGEEKPVRDDANVCGSNCRVKRWRLIKAETGKIKEEDVK